MFFFGIWHLLPEKYSTKIHLKVPIDSGLIEGLEIKKTVLIFDWEVLQAGYEPINL